MTFHNYVKFPEDVRMYTYIYMTLFVDHAHHIDEIEPINQRPIPIDDVYHICPVKSMAISGS